MSDEDSNGTIEYRMDEEEEREEEEVVAYRLPQTEPTPPLPRPPAPQRQWRKHRKQRAGSGWTPDHPPRRGGSPTPQPPAGGSQPNKLVH